MVDYTINGGYVREFSPTTPGNPYSDTYWTRDKNPADNVVGQGPQLKAGLTQSLRPFPKDFVRISPTRNTLFFFPNAASTPSPLGVAGAPPIGVSEPTVIGRFPVAGSQVNK